MFLEDKGLGPIGEDEWAKFRREQLQELPEALKGHDLPDILLPKQAELLAAIDAHDVVVADKSRRVGFTWGIGSCGVLTAGAAKSAGGMDVLYIGYNLDMAREFIDCCAMWAKAFVPAITEVGEFLFADMDSKGEPRGIQAFRIGFASGFEIVALSSRPRSLRGRQGMVILDEFAFHDDAEGLLKAAMAFLIWGGKVVVVSTHDGVDNPFNKLIQDIHSGEQPGAVVQCTFDQALAEGLYQRICLIREKEWSPEAEAEWRAKIYKTYRHNADEELRCIPSSSSGTFLSRALIEARMTKDIPVVRWKSPAGFVDWAEHLRDAEIRDFCERELRPPLAKCDPRLRSCLGQDFGRSGDLSVIHPAQVRQDLTRVSVFVLELRDVPFEAQKQIVFYIIDRLPRFAHAAFDATGNGSYQAEVTRQKLGASMVSEIKLSLAWYILHMPKLKAAFEDGSFLLPADDDVATDYRAIVMSHGVAKVPDNARTEGKDGFMRHGDAAIAGALVIYASGQDVGEVRADLLGLKRETPAMMAAYAQPTAASRLATFGQDESRADDDDAFSASDELFSFRNM